MTAIRILGIGIECPYAESNATLVAYWWCEIGHIDIETIRDGWHIGYPDEWTAELARITAMPCPKCARNA